MSSYLRPDGGLLSKIYTGPERASTVRRVGGAPASDDSQGIVWLTAQVEGLTQRVQALENAAAKDGKSKRK
jgi:hypothetical protein